MMHQGRHHKVYLGPCNSLNALACFQCHFWSHASLLFHHLFITEATIRENLNKPLCFTLHTGPEPRVSSTVQNTPVRPQLLLALVTHIHTYILNVNFYKMLECSLPQDLKIPCHKTKNVTLVSSVVDMALIPGGSLISKIFIVAV